MAEDTEQDQKTEDATSKRLSEARDEGNLPVSREMSSWFMTIGILLVIAWLGPAFSKDLLLALRPFVEKPQQISLEDGGLQNALMGIVSTTGFSLTLLFGVLVVMAVLGTMIQTGFYAGTGKMKFDLAKLMPSRGLSQLFSMNSVSELVKSFFKLVVLGYVAYRVLTPVFQKLPSIVEINLLSSMVFFHDNLIHLITLLLLVITVIAVADILYVRHRYFKGLRMSKQEVKDENKQMEGDPMIKGRLRQIRLEKSRRRMMAEVPTASVVLTNPTHYAVALRYEGLKMAAPVVVAKGVDQIAARIRATAEEHGVPLVSNPPLTRALYEAVDLDEPIQPEHYRAVAEVISYVYKLKNSKR